MNRDKSIHTDQLMKSQKPMVSNHTKIVLLVTAIVVFGAKAIAGEIILDTNLDPLVVKNYRVEPQTVKLSMPNVETASVTDASLSTGSTLFFFPKGARANFDARGGSVASIETTLLEEGSYSNYIDGIVFSGGSTLGLAATDGVRAVLFEERKSSNKLFDAIPSIPGAVVYDFGSGRIAPYNLPFVYPTAETGHALMAAKKAGEFLMGRTGAGVNTSFNKMGEKRWGGQGYGTRSKGDIQVMAFVILNAVGDVKLPNGQSITPELKPINKNGYDSLVSTEEKPTTEITHPISGTNTTLSLIVTNAKLDRSELKRLAVMTHTGMAALIRPFHTSGDGDMQYTVSYGERVVNEDEFFEVLMMASEAMSDAIYNGIRASNPPAK